jgi:hypothetical protein
MTNAEREEKIAKVFARLNAALSKRSSAPVKPAPKVMERVVEVASKDKNYRAETGGQVRVTVACEQAYWDAVDRAFNPPIFAEVVSSYDPFARHRMPGYDPEDDR